MFCDVLQDIASKTTRQMGKVLINEIETDERKTKSKTFQMRKSEKQNIIKIQWISWCLFIIQLHHKKSFDCPEIFLPSKLKQTQSQCMQKFRHSFTFYCLLKAIISIFTVKNFPCNTLICVRACVYGNGKTSATCMKEHIF